ncbi:MAG: hypothetical protein K2Y37_27205 [Pirellulales bacterium]|nr:hypothetical protein [Pirellulales bacterium]
MKKHDRLTATGLVVLMLVLWLGFLVHRSPRFAGSLWGGMLGISGAALMLVPLAYMVVKRIGPLKRLVTRRIAMRTLLTWHIYAGILGPILALLHTGHKFVSPLGIALTALMLLVVLSGFLGRYLLSQFSDQIRTKKEMLTQLEIAYQQTAGELSAQPQQIAMLSPLTGLLSRLGARLAWAHGNVAELPVSARALRISESMADLEYAIKTHETFKRLFGHWLRFHIVISLILYGLLALHIWAGIYFGLRWLS